MYKVITDNKTFYARDGELLSEILMKNQVPVEHQCGGMGTCKKCVVRVNGEEVLACRYRIHSDISVNFSEHNNIYSETGILSNGVITDNMCMCLDIGTTTLALALVSLDTGKTVRVITADNPQRICGADVISRIEYCSRNTVSELHSLLIDKVNGMIEEFALSFPIDLFVAGNVTMLHTFFGEDCASIGVAPYKPKFLGERSEKGEKLGLQNTANVISLPSIHSFVGADIVAGINFVGVPDGEKYNLLVDLGTNAEIVLFNSHKALCTAASAGPCFEGANIECGMSATDGAVCEYKNEKGMITINTVNRSTPKGICGTGLIDIIAYLIDKAIDKSGYMYCNFIVCNHVYLTPKDVRQFQLAKSAVYSAIETLAKRAGIDFEKIDKVFLSGGFSAKIDIENAVKTGILPKELKDKCTAVNNSSLLGTIKYSLDRKLPRQITDNSEYADMSSDPLFAELFVKNMNF